LTLASLIASSIALIFSAPVRMRSQHIWIFGLRLLRVVRDPDFFIAALLCEAMAVAQRCCAIDDAIVRVRATL
jgi:hypothetical protein